MRGNVYSSRTKHNFHTEYLRHSGTVPHLPALPRSDINNNTVFRFAMAYVQSTSAILKMPTTPLNRASQRFINQRKKRKRNKTPQHVHTCTQDMPILSKVHLHSNPAIARKALCPSAPGSPIPAYAPAEAPRAVLAPRAPTATATLPLSRTPPAAVFFIFIFTFVG